MWIRMISRCAFWDSQLFILPLNITSTFLRQPHHQIFEWDFLFVPQGSETERGGTGKSVFGFLTGIGAGTIEIGTKREREHIERKFSSRKRPEQEARNLTFQLPFQVFQKIFNNVSVFGGTIPGTKIGLVSESFRYGNGTGHWNYDRNNDQNCNMTSSNFEIITGMGTGTIKIFNSWPELYWNAKKSYLSGFLHWYLFWGEMNPFVQGLIPSFFQK